MKDKAALERLYVPVIFGTGRKGNNTTRVATFVFDETKRFGFDTELMRVGDFPQTHTAEGSKGLDKIGEKLKKADGFLVVSPEYNHGYPGELKMFLDYFYEEFNRKPIGFCGAGGTLGGGRMVEQLRLVAIELQMVPVRNAAYFMNVGTLFDETGKLKHAAAYQKHLKPIFEELSWYGKALKEARTSA